MKYRTKPVEVEAVRFTGDVNKVQGFTGVAIFNEVDREDRGDNPEIVAEVYDRLHSTWVGVKLGQWIIRGTKGEFYPCDDEVFREKYELVTNE